MSTSTKDDNFFDCTITAGYYSLNGSDVAQHTYAIAKKGANTYALPCFGSFALSEGERGHTGVNYEADLWSPWIVGSQNQGKSMAANLSVALGMAQFKLAPDANWRVEDWDKWWRENPRYNGYSVSSWAGLIYAVTGVCHQACNRILWSSRKGWFVYTPVNWPPSLSASYWIYGFYGKAADAAYILAQALVEKALRGDAARGEVMKGEALARDVMAHQLRTALRTEDDAYREARKYEVHEILDKLPRSLRLADSKAADRIYQIDGDFFKAKLDFDRDLILTNNSSGHDEYARHVNEKFNAMLDSFREIMPRETFETLFPDVRQGVPFALIDRNLMPDDYSRFQTEFNL